MQPLSFIVGGLPPDDWEWNDCPLLGWGMGSRVRAELDSGEIVSGIVVGAVLPPGNGPLGWKIGIRQPCGRLAEAPMLTVSADHTGGGSPAGNQG